MSVRDQLQRLSEFLLLSSSDQWQKPVIMIGRFPRETSPVPRISELAPELKITYEALRLVVLPRFHSRYLRLKGNRKMRLARSLSWIGIAQVAGVVLQFGSSVVLAHLLTPYDMGIYAVAVAVVGAISILQAFGLQGLIVREASLSEEVSVTAFTVNALLSMFLSIVIVGVALLSGRWLHASGVQHVLFALSLNPLIAALSFLPAAHLERAAQFNTLALAGIASAAGSAAVSIVTAWSGARYMSAAYAGWASAVLYAGVLNTLAGHHVRLRFNLTQWRRVTRYGLQMLAISGLSQIGGRLTDLCLAKFQGLAGLGLYSRSSSLNGLIWNNIHNVASKVMLPEFAAIHRAGKSIRQQYLNAVSILTAILWPTFLGLAIISGPLIEHVYGHRWVGAAPVLATVSCASVITSSSALAWEVFAITDNLALQGRLEVYNAIVNTVTFAIGSKVSLVAAAGTRVVSSLFANILYRRHLYRLTNTSTIDYLPIYMRSAFLSALAVGPSCIVMGSHNMSAETPIAAVVVGVCLGVCLWLIGLAALNVRHVKSALIGLRILGKLASG